MNILNGKWEMSAVNEKHAENFVMEFFTDSDGYLRARGNVGGLDFVARSLKLDQNRFGFLANIPYFKGELEWTVLGEVNGEDMKGYYRVASLGTEHESIDFLEGKRVG